MIAGTHAQSTLTPAQLQQQQESQRKASEDAKRRSRRPTDKNIPEGVEEYVIGDGVQRYRELRDVESKLDAAMMRKRLDIQDSSNRNFKVEPAPGISDLMLITHQRYRTLRVWISNTVEDQPWQGDDLDVDAFDFSTNMDSSYRVKIEGRLLSEEGEDVDDDNEGDETVDGAGHEPDLGGDSMDEDVKESKKPKETEQRHKFSHFFKAMTVEFERNRTKDGVEHSVEWKKPAIPPNATNPPNAADFDQLEFKRGGDENLNITINLVRDEAQERFALSPVLAEIMDATEATRAEVVTGIWEYIKTMGLQEDDEKRSFRCDELLKQVSYRSCFVIGLH
jgi:SWI/SNF-related matrix-associated actin-dependent regulator of chromatin subfamily D